MGAKKKTTKKKKIKKKKMKIRKMKKRKRKKRKRKRKYDRGWKYPDAPAVTVALVSRFQQREGHRVVAH